MGFVRRQGEKFVCDKKEMRFRGLGIGSWLNMEHFMLGLPTTHSGIREAFCDCFGKERWEAFWKDFVYSFCGEADFAFLKETGVNLVRVPFHYGLFLDDDDPEVWKEEGFAYFDRLLELCSRYQIYLLPDLHATPGGQNPDWHSDNQTGDPQFWHFRAFQEQMVRLWGEFARRYANEEYLLGFDLLNEPFLIGEETKKLQRFYDEATERIRRVDQNHLIFLEGDHFAMDFQCLGEIKDEQTALTFHYYPTVWDKELDNADYPRQRRRQVFDERFAGMLSDMRRFGRPLLCGEAGYDIAGHSLSHVMEMVEDTLDIFEKYGISWTLWCYKDAQFVGMVYPVQDSAWMRFASQIRESWTHYWEMEQGQRLVEEMSGLFEKKADSQLKYELQFRQRSLLSVLQREQLLKPQLLEWGWERVKELPASLRFENCGYYSEYRKLLAAYCR